MASQADGKIVAVGHGQPPGGNGYHFQVARYNSDGALDNNFGNGGIVITNVSSQDAAASVVTQSDGKIVVGGNISLPSKRWAIVRYNNNGTLDNTFGIGGVVSTTVNLSPALLSEVVLQSDGKIVAGGYAGNHFMVVRYNHNGTLDNSFGSGGIALDSLEGKASMWSIIIQPDDKIVSAGRSNSKFTIVRYNINGSLDSTFGNGGQLITTIGPLSTDVCTDIALLPDGKIVAVGFSSTNLQASPIILARINANGSFDNSFGINGVIKTNTYPLAKDLVVQTNGKIVVCGTKNLGSGYDFSLIRFNADGTLDAGFGNSGNLTIDIGSGSDYAQCMTLQSDQKIIVAGSSRTSTVAPSYPADFSLARLTTDVVGIAEQATSFISNLIIYPNPVSNELSISLPQNVTVNYSLQIVNCLGEIVLKTKYANKINVSDLPSGFYVLKLSENNIVKDNVKFIKE